MEQTVADFERGRTVCLLQHRLLLYVPRVRHLSCTTSNRQVGCRRTIIADSESYRIHAWLEVYGVCILDTSESTLGIASNYERVADYCFCAPCVCCLKVGPGAVPPPGASNFFVMCTGQIEFGEVSDTDARELLCSA